MQAPIGIDQQAYFDLMDEGVLYLESLSTRLVQSYDELYTQRIEVEDIGVAAEAIIFATDKLKEQKIKLEAHRSELRRAITSELGAENR